MLHIKTSYSLVIQNTSLCKQFFSVLVGSEGRDNNCLMLHMHQEQSVLYLDNIEVAS